MNYLLDEQLHEETSRGLSVFGERHGDAFAHIVSRFGSGIPDEEIPALCRDAGFEVLITANVKDFGARKALYQALLDHGLHVVVVRPGKQRFVSERQAALFLQHYGSVRRHLTAGAPTVLVVVTPSSVRHRTVADLLEEIEGGSRLP